MAATAVPTWRPTYTIDAHSGWQIADLKELWRYRELLQFLVWRDVKVRYKQTVLGAAWAVLQPLVQMAVFSAFFGQMASMPSGDTPYPLFVFAGLVPWNFFSNALSSACGSVIANHTMITKVYFPRLFIPASAIGAGVLDLGIALTMLLGTLLFYQAAPTSTWHFAPLLLLALIAAILGTGSLISALTVRYRDFRHIVPFMIQVWMFATPAIYMQTGNVRRIWKLILPLNPAQGLIEGFRASLLGQPLDPYSVLVSSAVAVVLLVVGCAYFARAQKTFADVI
jgi:lipopolysaccharide transport system permease protein